MEILNIILTVMAIMSFALLMFVIILFIIQTIRRMRHQKFIDNKFESLIKSLELLSNEDDDCDKNKEYEEKFDIDNAKIIPIDYSKFDIKTLKTLAKQNNIKNYYSLKKQELVEALEALEK